MEPKKDLLADINLPSLLLRRAKAVDEQKEAVAKVQTAKAGHFLRFWLGGGVMLIGAVWLGQVLPESSPIGMFLLSAAVILWLGMWIAAFFSNTTVLRLQDKAVAASKRVMEIDLKIAFCHQVLEEAKKVKVRKYAQALVEKKETS